MGAGIRFTDFHAMSVCTPSRASLMTGRLGLRTGVVVNFWTDALYGLPLEEITLPQKLKEANYDTKIIGKWHLGHSKVGANSGYHPTFRGFDEYTGIPYSVDMGCVNCLNYNLPAETPCPYDNATKPPDTGEPALPLYNSTAPYCTGHSSCNSDIVQQPVDLTELSNIYAATATEYIHRHANPNSNPFLLYVPFGHMHVPLSHDPKWTNTSARNNVFGDTLMELDHTIGLIWQAIKDSGISDNTLIILSSDNGFWGIKCDLAGTAGPWKGEYQSKLGGGSTGKLSTWEGGHRVVGSATWAGKILPNQVSTATVSTLDIFPTLLSLAGIPLPTDRVYDGYDISPIFFNQATKVRDWLYHPNVQDGNFSTLRYLNYTGHFVTWGAPGCNQSQSPFITHNPPLIFDLSVDPAQSTPLTNPDPNLINLFMTEFTNIWYNITHTYRSITNYSQKIGNEPCCNANNAVCRCTE